jgi:hypothetical protein
MPHTCPQGSNLSAAARDVMGGAAEFNPSCPDGSYQLNLAAAADRAVVQQLVVLDVQSGQDLMRNITLDGRNVASCRKAGWPERLPIKGMLACDFVSRRLKKDVPIIDGRKFNNLLKQFSLSSVSEKDKLALLELVAPFTYFTCKQVGPARLAQGSYHSSWGGWQAKGLINVHLLDIDCHWGGMLV